MRTYLIEDFYAEDLQKVCAKLQSLGYAGGMEGVYYLPLPEHLQNEEQRAHRDECGPFIFAIEAVDDNPDAASLRLELLVRARGKLRCSCVMYADAAQRAYAMDTLDALIRDLDISV